ncbi:hypothetical protein DXB02_17870 [Blautia sp. OF11-22]|nr:hypothetical protein DXB02_17870 [Blautia sp. OF11-22]
MIKILFVCHGNICRSTLAESVFTHKVNSLGLATILKSTASPPAARRSAIRRTTGQSINCARSTFRSCRITQSRYMEGLRARRLHHRHGYREYPQSEPDAEK